MTECTAVDCGTPTDNGYLCSKDAWRLERTLGDLPAWLNELTTTIARQAHTSGPDGGKATPKWSQPLVFDIDAAELLDQAARGLDDWVRQFAADTSPARLDPVTASQLLLALVADIALHPCAGELLGAVSTLRDEIRRRVDNLGKRWAGPCTATVQPHELVVSGDTHLVVDTVPTGEPRECGADLRTRPGAKVITCRECGAEYDPVERAQWIVARSAEHMATAAFIAAALTDAGKPVKAATIRKWAERGKLFAWREDDLARPLYRVGDVQELVEAASAQHAVANPA